MAAAADMLLAVFKSAVGRPRFLDDDESSDFLCTHSQMAKIFFWSAIWIHEYLVWAQENISNSSNQRHLQDIDAQYILTFKFVTNNLKDEISDLESNVEEYTPSVLFYLASIFVFEVLIGYSGRNALRNKDSNFGQGLGSLLDTLLQYRTRTSGQKNDLLETYFANKSYFGYYLVRFSEEWWAILIENGRDIGLKAAEQGTHILPVLFARLNTVIDL
jgi:hypothetical protein